MKKWTAGIWILAILLGLAKIACAEVSTNLDTRTTYVSSNRKLIESMTYVDGEGNPAVASDKGYAEIRYYYTTGNNISMIEFLDEGGNLIDGNDGYAVQIRKYTLEKLCEQRYYNANREPVLGPEGYHRLVTTYEEKQPVSTWRYDTGGNPVGVHQIIKYRKYINFCLVLSEAWYDVDGEPAPGPNGYARAEYQYTGRYRSRTAYFGTDGSPYFCAIDGFSVMENDYRDGKVTETRYFDTNGEPAAGRDGYARVHYTYSGSGRTILAMYYNADGSLYYNKDGICGIQQRLDKNKVVDECYFIDEGIRGNNKDGYSRIVRQYTSKGMLTMERYFDENDQITVPSGIGYATVKYYYTNIQYLTYTFYFDEHHKLIPGPDGYAALRNEYDSTYRLVQTLYLDSDGKTPINCSQGYARVKYRRNSRKNPLSIRYYDADGKPVSLKDGEDETRYTWNGNRMESESYWVDGKPVNGTEGYHKVIFKYNGNGNLVQKSFFTAEGDPTACNGGYASVRTEYNSLGQVIATIYYDTEGRLVTTPGKEYAYRWTFFSRDLPYAGSEAPFPGTIPENCTVEAYYGTDGNLMNLGSGYACIVWEKNSLGQVYRISWFDKDLLPARNVNEVSVIRREYDEYGHITEESYYGPDEEPVAGADGYHRIERTYLDARHLSGEAWFDVNDDPLALYDTYCRIAREFDENGNVILLRYYGADGNPVACSAGYDEVRRRFDENGQIVSQEYLLNGKLLSDNQPSVTAH